MDKYILSIANAKTTTVQSS